MHISQTASERKSENAGRGRRESLVWRDVSHGTGDRPAPGGGDHFGEETAPSAPLLTKADLFACGLSGGREAGKTAGSAA